ncbi:hypothetical protein [Comamonas sp. JC664]|uniref:hypothetical protein n=1 Tax=Comamonas sp. JC664 TaxID=2801917 RepID=UPI0017483C5F|nr:hypothetical protein [Comamonas sp. JC664]MBL0698492.1 hypothetical protein [Comamonas sp. JC664]GHH00138.1 hypothetical protein GCM10012319_66960 [Comamonas sp. KCTC 72670]
MELKTPVSATAPTLQPMSFQGIEVIGQSILAIVNGMELAQSRALRILGENGIAPLKADTWYPMPALLKSFQLVFDKIGPSTVRTIGRKIPDSAHFPPDIDTLEKGLRAVDMAYRMNHRGKGGIGGYRFEAVDRRNARMVCDNPYPCDLDLGLIEAIGDRFRPKDSLWVRIEHEAKSCRRRGDSSCTYSINW